MLAKDPEMAIFFPKTPRAFKISRVLTITLLMWFVQEFPGMDPASGQRMPGGSDSLELSTPEYYRQNLPASPLSLPAQRSEEAYQLGAGDRVQVVLFRLPQYSGEYEVQVNGQLNLALVGAVDVQGLTVNEATAVISTAYGQLLRRPIVTLNVTSRRLLEVGIAGEVNRPGAYVLGGEGGDYPTLTRLLQTAEGITPSADLRNVQITRQVEGRNQTFRADLWHLLNTGDLSQDVVLRDGDRIFIPSTLVPLDESGLLADANFYTDVTRPINIAVVGEVFRPGPYRLRGGSTRTGDAGVPGGEGGTSNAVTVTDAIQVAGGIKPLANIRKVEVRRTTRLGEQEVFQVDLWKLLQTGDLKQNAILQEGDTVFIPTATEAPSPEEASQTATATFSPNTIRINVVGEVRNGGLIEVPPNTPLNQGILAAGGFNNRAQENVVGLVRLNPDGTVTQREIDIDFTEGISEDANPMLQNNDIIIVGTSGLAEFSDTLGTVASPLADFLFILGAPFRFLNLFD
jgi:polysaccharide export outer membrane protein